MVTFITGGDEPFYEQVAIVSGGFGDCGSTEFPGIYVRLEDYQVLSWIYRVAFGQRLPRPNTTPSVGQNKPNNSIQSIQSTQPNRSSESKFFSVSFSLS